MNTKIAKGMLAFAAMIAISAGTASAAPPFPDKATITVAQFRDNGEDEVFVLSLKEEEGGDLGDAVYTLFSPEQGLYLTATGKEAGSEIGYSRGDKSKWVFHRNSTGWSFMLKGKEEHTISKGSNGKELQRNQGRPNQVWQITSAKSNR